MGNSLRCCLACVLPFGALDLIRIVHLNGYVEELSGPATAGQVLKNNPDHVLTKPSSQDVGRRILILSPDSELKRGSIYFLIPTSSLPANIKNKKPFSKSGKGGEKEMSIGNDSHDTSKKTEKRYSYERRASVVVWRPNLLSMHFRGFMSDFDLFGFALLSVAQSFFSSWIVIFPQNFS